VNSPRCHICNRPATTGWCRGPAIIECNFIARRALGVPEWQAKRIRSDDRRAQREGRAA
jgi:hypothetical protein